MSNVKVICISGKARSGKDTSADIMRKILWGDGKRVLIIHYADLVKYMCKTLFGWNGQKDEYGRHLLQYVGTDVVRAQNPNYWVDYVIGVAKMFDGLWDYIIVPDTRFPNEIAGFKDSGFDVVHMRIVREAEHDNPLTDEQKKHPSECALDDTIPDTYIYNNGDIVDLTRELIKFRMQMLPPV